MIPNPRVRPPLLSDEAADGSEEAPVREMEVGDSVAGMVTAVGVGLKASSGECAGEGEAAEVSGAREEAKGVSEEGDGVAEGDPCGARFTAGEAVGGGAEVVAGLVPTSSFIPWLQCPIVPQMKYLFPAEERGIVVLPPL